ncbi:type II secretion system protein GspM [Pseudoduganella plicata]|uniref:MSHA biogenesis protein MshJ n=1 Tax=Pseudoduganella plicata TaxID=321984 RepID=A0A4P7BA86_9BURK|nr:type II secretion system protein GspM [Pseudoduganella plicata]QBQ35000.1 hypothetical protein E1742_01530 [Pseudoduganella plicata]GGZ06684.1 hypothetical protein GCM10007388_45300 [Pseudoduganella plicata]
MKALWLKYAARIDALSVRERVMIALGGAAAIVFLVYFGLIDPAHARERTLQATIAQQRSQLAAIDVEVVQKQAAAMADPDADARKRLVTLTADNEALRGSLRATQKALVPPARMSALLGQMVQQNSRLKLVSLKTLPPAGTTDGNFADTPADAAAPVLPPTPLTLAAPGTAPATTDEAAQPLLYRHGVQVVLQGAYADMVAYMEALERMPAQVFWGRAVLDATEHDKATLTLTLYTLSLDEKWIAL